MIFEGLLHFSLKFRHIQFEVPLGLLHSNLKQRGQSSFLIFKIQQIQLIFRQLVGQFINLCLEAFEHSFYSGRLSHLLIYSDINIIKVKFYKRKYLVNLIKDKGLVMVLIKVGNKYIWLGIINKKLSYFIQFIVKMSSPSKYFSNSPVRHLEQRYSSRPLETILEQRNALIVSNSLIYQNSVLEKQNERLLLEYSRTKNYESLNYDENVKLKKERDEMEQRLRNFQVRSIAQNQYKERQLENQQRDIRFLREEFNRENQILRDQLVMLTNKLNEAESKRLDQTENLRRKYESNTHEQTDLIRKNLGDELRQVLGELQTARRLLGQKQRDLQHLLVLVNTNSLEYTTNLERIINQNTTLRNQLITLQQYKNREIQQAETKKQLEKSRNIGIISHNKENKYFLEREISRQSQELIQKNNIIESLSKELLKQKNVTQKKDRKFQETLSAYQLKYEEEIKEKDYQIIREEKMHKEEMQSMIIKSVELQQLLGSKQNQVQNAERQIDYLKHEIDLRDKEIDDLKEKLSNMHLDHSKELSKMMNESKVKRRSGLNISSYSSNSLKDIEEAHQGSSIMKDKGYARKSSFSNEVIIHSGSGRLPTVKEQLAVSHGHIEDDQQDIQIKQLILHYESMLQQHKRNKANELQVANNKIHELKDKIQQQNQEIKELLKKYEPIMDIYIYKKAAEEERRQRIQSNLKGDIDILSVLLDKFQIVSLKSKKK